MNTWKGLALALLPVVLAGCKVSVSSGTDGSDHRSPSHPGFFFDARDTGAHFPSSDWSLSPSAQACIDTPLYFETASGRVRVYGSPAYSESDFQAAAAELERGIDGVLGHFQLSWREFVKDRSSAAPYPDQVLGCLTASVSSDQFAEASVSAISITPHYRQWPYEAD